MGLRTPINLTANRSLNDIQNTYTNRNTILELYRGRYIIERNEIAAITLYPRALSDEQTFFNTALVNTKVKTYTVRPEDTVREATSNIVSTLAQQYKQTFNIIVVNTYAQKDLVPGMVEYLTTLEDDMQMTKPDIGTALINNPGHSITCLASADHHLIVLLTNTIPENLLFKVGAILPTIFGFTQPEELTNAFLNLDGAEYSRIMLSFGENLEAKRLKAEQEAAWNLLETKLNASNAQALEQELNGVARDIENYNSSLKNLYIKQRAKQLMLLTERTQENKSGTELREYITNCKQGVVLSCKLLEGSYLQLHVKTPLLFWEESDFMHYKKGVRDNEYKQLTPELKQMLDDVLINKTYTIMFEQEYYLKTDTGYAERNNNYTRESCRQGMMHPHIFHHNCWGSNEPPIRKAMLNKQYIAALEQSIATLSGLNIADSTVFMELCYDIKYKYAHRAELKCLKDNATGELISIPGYIKRLSTATATEPATVLEPVDTITIAPTRTRTPVANPQPQPIRATTHTPEFIDADEDDDNAEDIVTDDDWETPIQF